MFITNWNISNSPNQKAYYHKEAYHNNETDNNETFDNNNDFLSKYNNDPASSWGKENHNE